MTSEALSRRPLEDSIAERVAMAGDYVSALRCSLALLQTHFHAAVAGVRLYNGHDRGGIFSLAVPENRRLAELESLFNTVFERKVPLCHRPDRGTRIGVLTLPEFPALAAPLLRNNHLEASVVVVRHRGLPFDLADLAELDRVLPLLAGTIQDAILQRTMIAGYLKTIEALALALEAKDPYTRGHSNMVCAYATAIAKQVGLSEDEQETIALGAIMHDLGKIGVPDAVLNKRGPLDAAE
ncbi:MAG TPA: HD domain-containing phosphohydrolase, partial [bacterium]|nr:HD domain-containing phosphohydrolase [bacterium]